MKSLLLALIMLGSMITANSQVLTMGGVQFKDQSNSHTYRVKVKNTRDVTVQVTIYYYTGQYVTFDLQPGDHEMVSGFPYSLLNMYVVIPVQLSENNWEAERWSGMMWLSKAGNNSP